MENWGGAPVGDLYSGPKVGTLLGPKGVVEPWLPRTYYLGYCILKEPRAAYYLGTCEGPRVVYKGELACIDARLAPTLGAQSRLSAAQSRLESCHCFFLGWSRGVSAISTSAVQMQSCRKKLFHGDPVFMRRTKSPIT